MKLTTRIIEKARTLREVAAIVHSCYPCEIDWPSCVGMALRGESFPGMERPEEKVFEITSAKHEYDFEIVGDPRKGKVYLAVITGLCEKYGLERDFVNLPCISGRNEKTVLGKVLLMDGTIVEEKRGGSWKNDYADYYRCVGGKKEWLAAWDDRKEIAKLFV